MFVLCTGMIRSGSTWSYNICMALCRAAFPNDPVSGGYYEDLEPWRPYATNFLITGSAPAASSTNAETALPHT